MKRLFIQSITIIILLLSACSYTAEVPNVPPNTEINGAEDTASQPTLSIPTQPTESNTETIAVTTEETSSVSASYTTELASKNTEREAENAAAIEVKTEESTQVTEVIDSVSATDPEPTIPEEPITIKAYASDCADIANRIIAYINEYRNVEGSRCAAKLPGLTEYTDYRSKQLVANFAHDTFDERAAATALQYGQYIDPELYGMNGEPYFTANAREAIAKTTFGGTVDAVAMHIARMARNTK